MEIRKILSSVDHTLLAPDATWAQIKAICDDGIKYKTASICIPPCFVKRTKEFVGDKIAVCTVIGFPCGYQSKEVKAFEAKNAIENGADELDMVINIGDLKDGKFEEIEEEIRTIKSICRNKILKVIIEACLLNDMQKEKMCGIVAKAKADYIKTSTGFSISGATKQDIALLAKSCPKTLKIKAAGGISSLQDAEDFLNLGAHRLGTSRIIKIVKSQDASGSCY